MRTVAGADQVVVLSGGIVAEQGSPAELYARKGLYAHMVDLQSDKPALGHLTQFKNSPAAQQKRASIQKNRCPF